MGTPHQSAPQTACPGRSRSPLWLKICHWHIFFTRRALKGKVAREGRMRWHHCGAAICLTEAETLIFCRNNCKLAAGTPHQSAPQTASPQGEASELRPLGKAYQIALSSIMSSSLSTFSSVVAQLVAKRTTVCSSSGFSHTLNITRLRSASTCSFSSTMNC